jgi:hypothetical protein
LGEGCAIALSLLILFLPVIMVFVRLYRLFNPNARGGRTAVRESLGCLGWLVAWVLIVALFIPPMPFAREAARRSCCNNYVKQIGLGMQNYAERYGCFPPAYTADSSGRPLHSWRVLLLPFVECERLYREVRLDEAWDSPHNSQVFAASESPDKPEAPRMPYVFRCPSDPERGPLTNYVMIVGPRTLSNGPNSVRPKEITDGASNTIAVVETYGVGIRWYEPRDLHVDEMSFKINDPEYFGIASYHKIGANVGFADASVRFVPDSTDPRAVEAATTISGGKQPPLPRD